LGEKICSTGEKNLTDLESSWWTWHSFNDSFEQTMRLAVSSSPAKKPQMSSMTSKWD